MYREMNPSFVAPELDESDSFMVVVLRSPGGFICGDEVRMRLVTAVQDRAGDTVWRC